MVRIERDYRFKISTCIRNTQRKCKQDKKAKKNNASSSIWENASLSIGHSSNAARDKNRNNGIAMDEIALALRHDGGGDAV